jgi:hypothetical protein
VKPGLYIVESWNNKDAILIREDGEFLSLTKNDLPEEFNGQLFLGETVEIAQVTLLRLSNTSLDERARSARIAEQKWQAMSDSMRHLVEAERQRRKLYGVKSL